MKNKLQYPPTIGNDLNAWDYTDEEFENPGPQPSWPGSQDAAKFTQLSELEKGTSKDRG